MTVILWLLLHRVIVLDLLRMRGHVPRGWHVLGLIRIGGGHVFIEVGCGCISTVLDRKIHRGVHHGHGVLRNLSRIGLLLWILRVGGRRIGSIDRAWISIVRLVGHIWRPLLRDLLLRA